MTTEVPSPAAAEPHAPARVRFNPFSPEFRADPYPAYRRLREAKPVHKTMGMWVLTRHADVKRVMHDRSFSVGLIPELVNQQVERVAQGGQVRVNVDRI